MQQPYLRNELYLAKRPRFLTESCNRCTTAACLVRMQKGGRAVGVRKLPVLLCKSGAFRRISFACRLYSCEKKIASLLRSSHDGAGAAAKTRTKFLGFTRSAESSDLRMRTASWLAMRAVRRTQRNGFPPSLQLLYPNSWVIIKEQ